MAQVLRQSRPFVGATLVLSAVAAACWVVTVRRMQGMDMGWGTTELGSLGWFAGVWATMMAAMMLPSLIPAAAEHARAARGPGSFGDTLQFASGYLLAWSAAGLITYAVIDAIRPVAPHWLAWDQGGRYLAAAVLLTAAGYELTPQKAGCLGRCRAGSPPTRRVRTGPLGPLLNGLQHAGYCIGCCGALMAGLFALGVMSIAWMAVVAAVIAAQKLLPWDLASTRAAAALFAVLAVVAIV